MKTNIKLDKEEQALLKSIENDKGWQSVPNLKQELALAKQAAKETIRKNARINIRMSNLDLDRIKRIAVYEGLPYQTLVSSILHKYACGHLRATRA